MYNNNDTTYNPVSTSYAMPSFNTEPGKRRDYVSKFKVIDGDKSLDNEQTSQYDNNRYVQSNTRNNRYDNKHDSQYEYNEEDNRYEGINSVMNSSIPAPRPTNYINNIPYKHMLKRNDNIKLEEILGTNQNYDKLTMIGTNNNQYNKQPYQQANYQQTYNTQPSNQQQYTQPSNQQTYNIHPSSQQYTQTYQQNSQPYNHPYTQTYPMPYPQQPVKPTYLQAQNNMNNTNNTYNQNTQYQPRVKFIDENIVTNNTNMNTNESVENNIKQKVYNAVIEYFSGFVMTKVSVYGKYSVYKSSVKCLLCDGGIRYVVAIVADDNDQIGTKKKLSTLKWVSFQTRYSDDDTEFIKYRLTNHQYKKPENTVLDDVIRLVRKTSNSSIYNSDNLPIQVEIIHTKDDESIADTGTVSGAIELFSTVIEFTQ